AAGEPGKVNADAGDSRRKVLVRSQTLYPTELWAREANSSGYSGTASVGVLAGALPTDRHVVSFGPHQSGSPIRPLPDGQGHLPIFDLGGQQANASEVDDLRLAAALE